MDIRCTLDRVLEGERIGKEEALRLFCDADLPTLSVVATAVRNRHNAPDRVSYVVDRNVNYTDVCNVNCSFCAFYKRPGGSDTYVLGHEELKLKAEETLAVGGTGFLLQGGVNPDLPWSYYLDQVRLLKELGIWVHGYSPIEIRRMSDMNGLGLRGTLAALRRAGLGSLPGGGAEVLVDRIRQRIAPRKGSAADWLEVMEAAHEEGLKTTGTMMFGITETLEDRIEHLHCLRDQQDRARRRSNNGGYTAFAAWPFQSGCTPWEGRVPKPSDDEYLRTIAISRIYLDNFDHIQSSWVTMGSRTGQMALHYGCDDMGSLMLEEHVVSAAGTHHMVDRPEMDRMIRAAGCTPWQRDNLYNTVRPQQH